MSMGMTYDEFWEGDVKRTIAYRKANELTRRQQNQFAWLQGRYIYDALCEASPLFRMSFSRGRISPADYTKEPYPITDEEKREREERRKKAEMERLKAAFMQFSSGIAQKIAQRTQSAESAGSVADKEKDDGYGNRQPTNQDSIERRERGERDQSGQRSREESERREESTADS